MKKHAYIFALTILAMTLAVPVSGQDRWYFGTEVGGGLAPKVDMHGTSTDRASVCDEYINPQYASVPGCTVANRGSGAGWDVMFGGATGLLGDLSLGYQVTNWLRLEAEYAVWHATYDDVAQVGGGSGATGDKLNQEIFIAQEWLGSFNASGFFANVYMDHQLPSRLLGLYAGLGAGVAITATGYSSLWARNKNVDAIKTGADQPNADEIRKNLAGSVSNGQGTLRVSSPVAQMIVGVDRYLSEHVSIGVKARYILYFNYESVGDLVWDPLRSHVPNLRLDGSEPVHGILSTSDFSALTFGVVMKHRF